MLKNLLMPVIILLSSLLLPTQVEAVSTSRFGNSDNVYTNLCGSGTVATCYGAYCQNPPSFNENICPANCDPSAGYCSNDIYRSRCEETYNFCSTNQPTVAKFTCDGKVTNCEGSLPIKEDWGTVMDFSNWECNKTYQIDVFDKNCRDGSGNWTCDDNNLKGYMTWYSGACSTTVPTATPTKTITPTKTVTPTKTPVSVPVCNEDEVVLTVSPSSVRVGDKINFTIKGDASTYISDTFGNSVTNCTGSWNNITCTASKTGDFYWAHNWRKCEGTLGNCSEVCSEKVRFTIAQPAPTPSKKITPTPTRTPTRTPTPTTPPQGGVVDNRVSCPEGFEGVLSGSTIICLQQNQNQNQDQWVNSSSNASTGPINVNVTSPEPKVITVAGSQISKELPKTGLPLAAWALSGLLPVGAGLRRFGVSKKSLESANFIWQKREFLKH